MSYIQISFIVMISIFTIYITFVWVLFGILPSISDSYYRLEALKKRFLFWDISILFPMWAAGIAITAMLCCDNNLYINIAGAGLLLVGAAPYFKSALGKLPHYIGAITAIVGTQAYMWISLPQSYWYFPIIFIVLATVIITDKDNDEDWMWWLEVVAFISFFTAQGIYLF